MNTEKLIIYSVDRISHHSDYAKFFKKLFPNTIIIESKGQQIRYIFSKSTIVFLDIDLTHAFFFPLMLIRALLGKKSVTLSVSSEKLKEKIDLRSSKWTILHRVAMFFLKGKKNIKNVTIHNESDVFYKMYYSDFIKDPQYWDLPYLSYGETIIPELEKKRDKKVISILGTFNEKRYSAEIKKVFKNNNFENSDVFLLIAGKMSKEDELELSKNTQIITLPRKFSNEELMYLYKISDFIVCFYKNISRPSGFFGRALQLNKFVITLENGYLSKYNYDYHKVISINKIEDLLTIDYNSYTSEKEERGSNDYYLKDFDKLSNVLFDW